MQTFHSVPSLRTLNSYMLCFPECYFPRSLSTLELRQLAFLAFFFSILFELSTSSFASNMDNYHLAVSVDYH